MPSKPDNDPLQVPVLYLKGGGPVREPLLHRLELRRAIDLLFYFPRDYQDFTQITPASAIQENVQQTVFGVIQHYETQSTRRGKLLKLKVNLGPLTLEAIWFNAVWQVKNFAVGRPLFLTGKPQWKSNGPLGWWQMAHPILFFPANEILQMFRPGQDDESELENCLPHPFLPVYPLTEGLQQFHLQRIIEHLLPTLPDLLPEVLPEAIRVRENLPPISQAIREIHFPKNEVAMKAARRRFVWQEFFILQLALNIRKQQHRVNLRAPILEWSAKIDSRIRRILPFELTEGQNQVISEISNDLAQPVPMNRLLQGDVGSGKTMVAIYAMLQTTAGGHQAVLMAPTEILARQHLRTLRKILHESKVHIAPLFGGQKTAERAAVLQNILSGHAQIVVGTQAIICNHLEFHRLGLVVIDEQHKFGVRQRAHLKTGTKFDPHYLVMTATPIPRSVTMTLFGDLDVSVMKGLPPGRSKINTFIASEERRAKWWDFFRKKIGQGRQGYVVVPRVEENEQDDYRSVKTVFDELSNGELQGIRLGIVHGRLSNEEKEAAMIDFQQGEIQVLVCTSVIEVGIDVANATLMTIENAELFGLAQLHQLRGRIGRGKHPGFCCAFMTEKQLPDDSSDVSPPTTNPISSESESGTLQDRLATKKKDESRKRLDVFAHSTDGFELAEKDFELRGPGELFGTQQHGLPPFRIADLIRDRDILTEARAAATRLVQEDPGLALPEHQKLRKQVLTRYGAVLELGDVG